MIRQIFMTSLVFLGAFAGICTAQESSDLNTESVRSAKSSNHVYANFFTQTVQLVQPNTDISLELENSVSGIAIKKDRKRISFNTSGVYLIGFTGLGRPVSGSSSVAVPWSIALFLNGVYVPGSGASADTNISATSERDRDIRNSNFVIISVKKGDILELRNISSKPIQISSDNDSAASAPQPGASIFIELIRAGSRI